jgi:hypothetical protein
MKRIVNIEATFTFFQPQNEENPPEYFANRKNNRNEEYLCPFPGCYFLQDFLRGKRGFSIFPVR